MFLSLWYFWWFCLVFIILNKKRIKDNNNNIFKLTDKITYWVKEKTYALRADFFNSRSIFEEKNHSELNLYLREFIWLFEQTKKREHFPKLLSYYKDMKSILKEIITIMNSEAFQNLSNHEKEPFIKKLEEINVLLFQ